MMNEMEVSYTGRNFTGVTVTDTLSPKVKMILEVMSPHFVNGTFAKLHFCDISRALLLSSSGYYICKTSFL